MPDLSKPFIPIFPLSVVLFPGMPLPLHIFEEKYKEMIGECLAAGNEFGVLYHDGTRLYEVGCTAKIARLLHEYEDGRKDVLCQGVDRYSVQGINEDKSYLRAQVDFFVEEQETNLVLPEGVREEALEMMREILDRQGEAEHFKYLQESNPAEISYIIAAKGEFTAQEKQAILEMPTCSSRLEYELSVREMISRRREAKITFNKKIQRNGSVHHEEAGDEN